MGLVFISCTLKSSCIEDAYYSQYSAFMTNCIKFQSDTDIILSYKCISLTLTGCSYENTSSHENKKRQKEVGEKFIISHKLL